MSQAKIPMVSDDERDVATPPFKSDHQSLVDAGSEGKRDNSIHNNVLESESGILFPYTTNEVRLCVVKLPSVSDRPRDDHGPFENERDFLRKVKPVHEYIVRYFEVTDNFIFMEHCPLGCLEVYLKPHMTPPVRDWAIQLCSAMIYLHELGWAHNQLYPCNILVFRDGAGLKICDFDEVTPALEFGRGSYPGPPELYITASQTKVDLVTDAEGHLCDVYSFGLLLWFMQHGGQEMPENKKWDEEGRLLALPSHLDFVNVDGLQYGDLMRSCWAHYKSRLNSKMVMERLLSEA